MFAMKGTMLGEMESKVLTLKELRVIQTVNPVYVVDSLILPPSLL